MRTILKKKQFGIVLALTVLVVFVWIFRVSVKETFVDVVDNETLPAPVEYGSLPSNAVVPSPGPRVAAPVQLSLSSLEINLNVPFSPQAPHANWDQPYQDACEEATTIMVSHFIAGTPLNADIMDKEILEMVAFEEKNYGFAKDSNIKETTRLVNEYFPNLVARAVYDITVSDIADELVLGNAVVVLANGQVLANPNYTAPGPKKHAIVIKGITDGKFITNDPGTRRGADYVYTFDTVYRAIVDYDGGTAGTGKKAMIILSPAG